MNITDRTVNERVSKIDTEDMIMMLMGFCKEFCYLNASNDGMPLYCDGRQRFSFSSGRRSDNRTRHR